MELFFLKKTDNYIAIHDCEETKTYFSINQDNIAINTNATNINLDNNQYFAIRNSTTDDSIISADYNGNIVLNGILSGTAI